MNTPLRLVRKGFEKGRLRAFAAACLASLALGVGAPAAAKGLTVGFIMVGPKDDCGYNQSHAQGAAALAKLPGVKVVEQFNVPETVAVEETMEDMIVQDGAKALFPTSFGYFPHVLKVAKKYPDVEFFHCGGLYVPGDPANVGSYFGYIDEAEYVCGVVAGCMTKTDKLGFVAAKPIPQVLRNINSWTLGALSVNPKVTVQVVFTGAWSMPVKEAESVNSLVDQGVDVITCHVDSPKTVIETAARRGIYVTGYHADDASLDPTGYLTGAVWNWKVVYTHYLKMISEGKTLMNGGIPHIVRGGLREGYVRLSPFGPAVTPRAKRLAKRALKRFMTGKFVVYKGPMMDNTGKTVIPAGVKMPQRDPALEKMDWLVKGVIGNLAI